MMTKEKLIEFKKEKNLRWSELHNTPGVEVIYSMLDIEIAIIRQERDLELKKQELACVKEALEHDLAKKTDLQTAWEVSNRACGECLRACS
jgi:hypothetical protein